MVRRRCALCALWIASRRGVRPVFIGGVMLLNVIHPLIHGTPFDGGMLDSIMGQLDMVAAGLAQNP